MRRPSLGRNYFNIVCDLGVIQAQCAHGGPDAHISCRSLRTIDDRLQVDWIFAGMSVLDVPDDVTGAQPDNRSWRTALNCRYEASASVRKGRHAVEVDACSLGVLEKLTAVALVFNFA